MPRDGPPSAPVSCESRCAPRCGTMAATSNSPPIIRFTPWISSCCTMCWPRSRSSSAASWVRWQSTCTRSTHPLSPYPSSAMTMGAVCFTRTGREIDSVPRHWRPAPCTSVVPACAYAGIPPARKPPGGCPIRRHPRCDRIVQLPPASFGRRVSRCSRRETRGSSWMPDPSAPETPATVIRTR